MWSLYLRGTVACSGISGTLLFKCPCSRWNRRRCFENYVCNRLKVDLTCLRRRAPPCRRDRRWCWRRWGCSSRTSARPSGAAATSWPSPSFRQGWATCPMAKFWTARVFAFPGLWAPSFFRHFHLALGDRYRKFYRMLNNAKKPFNSIFNSKNFQPYSFKILFI